MRPFPESTCVECGQRMINGRVRRCPMTNDFCNWHIPKALGETASDMLEALKAVEKLLSQIATVFYNDKLQDHFPGGLADEVKAAFAKDSIGITAAIAKAERGTN